MSEGTLLMYGELADWYHLLSPPHEYAQEAVEVRRLLEEDVEPPMASFLEMGCGGGCLASYLPGDWSLTLTDPEAGMLKLSRTINPGAEHLEGDMRTMRLGRTFDAVLVHDAIDYMASEADLRAAFDTAFIHLRPGGAALFMPDWVTDDYAVRAQMGGSDQEGRGLRFIEWDREIEPDGHTVLADYIITTRDRDGSVSVFHDVHTLGIFPRAVWLRLLEAAGFKAHRFTSDEGLDAFIGVRPID